MLNTRKILSLALALALLLATLPCALAEDAEEWDGGLRRLRLGSSFYTVMIDDDFFLGDMTEEDVAEGQVAYYQRGDEGMDFDVYQFAKDEPADRPARYVLEEAMEQDHIIEIRPNERVGDIDIAWYRAIEAFDGAEYETLNVIADDGVNFVELVFWMADEADAAEAQAIVDSLQLVELVPIQLGDSPFMLYVPGDFEAGGLTLEDEDDDQMAYYASEATALDFDVYQFDKDGLPQSLSEYVTQEAAEYPVITELVTDGEINGVPVGWYRTVEECEEGEYDTITYVMDAGDGYVELVFWLDGFTAEAEADYIIHNLVDTRGIAADDEDGLSDEAMAYLEQGVVPVTWEPSSERLAIDTDEARALYDQISAGDYPSVEELLANPVVQQMDALAAYYAALYGDTSQIDTPEREQLRTDILAEFLSYGSARMDHVDDRGYLVYTYDGPLKAEYQAELVLGLPASGKSSMVADPDSDEMDAFILDSDMIKELIPEFRESHGVAADAVHEESKAILQKAIEAFCEGDMKGVNLIIPAVGGNLDSLQRRFIQPLEAAGYNVKVTFVEAKLNESLARAVRRGLKTGRIISSQVIVEYGDKPMQVYNTLATMVNAKGELYGYEPESGTQSEAEAGLESDVLVLFTSDVHCGVDQNFGYAGLQAVKDAAVAAGNHVLLVDDGDSIQGEPIGILTKGQADIELMNLLGYDIAIPGNHEFDYGMDRFLELADMADFPYISCNLNREGELLFDPYLIREFDGVKIAFVGVITPETLTSSTPRFFQDEAGNTIYGFMQGNGSELCAAVQAAVDDARAEGAEYVILMGHLGLDASAQPYTYADVVGGTTGIDAVLDGHSHDTEKVILKNKDGQDVVRQACGTKLQGIGWLRISAADGSVDTGLYTWNNDVPAPVLLGIENEARERTDALMEEVNDRLSEVVGVANVALSIYDPGAVDGSGVPVRIIRNAETNLGDLVSDAFRVQSGADIGITSGGGLRGGFAVGDITYNDLIKVMPFNNKVYMAEVTGQQILDALEWGARAKPEESGAFCQVSGLTYEIHTAIESGCVANEAGMFAGVDGEYRVQNVMVSGEPLDPGRTYTVCAQSYLMVDHGSGHTAFDGAKIIWEYEDLDYELVADYIRDTLGGVVGEGYEDPYGQERIVAVEEPADGAASGDTDADAASAALPEGVVPVTWEVTPEHPMIDTDEARALYQQILAGDYPTMEELLENPVVQQLDALSAYYKSVYGNTADIDTPEREALREELKNWFLTLGSARTESVDENGKHHYVYDGPLNRDYQMELVLGLPASGKSTRVADPDSEALGAFILDPDVIKAELPEYKESHGAAADAIHFEGMGIFDRAISEFLTGDMQGVNIVLPIVGGDFDEMMQQYVLPFEAAGYNVKVKFCPAKENEAAARVVMRELGGGQMINSAVAFNFGDGPENVYNELKDMINAKGEPYGFEEEEDALEPAA